MPPEIDQFRRLFDANYKQLVAYARRRLASPQDADDLVAEVFTVAWRRRDRLPQGDDARLYLYGIARRVLANQRRATRRRTALVAALRGAAPWPPGDPMVEDPAVARALAALDDQDRELLRLLAWEGLTQIEVASVMEISVEAARSRIRRARARFADLLDQMGAERTVGLAGDRP